jgi:hypothetical protein
MINGTRHRNAGHLLRRKNVHKYCTYIKKGFSNQNYGLYTVQIIRHILKIQTGMPFFLNPLTYWRFYRVATH